MMDRLYIAPTDYTPKVLLDPKSGVFEISGCSLPDDTLKFYMPIIQWTEHYAQHPNPQTVFVIALDFVNSSSSKMLIDLLFTLQKITQKGGEVELHWKYDAQDDVIETIGICIQESTNIPFFLDPVTV